MPSLPTCFRRAPSFLIQMEVLTSLGGGEGGWRRRRMGAHVYQVPVLCHLLYPLRIKIHLSCPRQYTLGQLLPRGHLLTVRRVTLGAGSSSDGNHRKWLPRPSIFPRREKSPCPSDRLKQGSRFSPGAIKNICSPALWHGNQKLSALYALGFILPRASVISWEWSGAFRVACQALEPQGVTQCWGEERR